MAIVRGIHRISDWLDKFGSVVCLVMLGAMVIITGLQIVCRVFFTALSWSEEAARYLLVWSTFIGASCVYKHGGHISVTLLQGHLPRIGSQILQIVVHLLCGLFFVLMIIYGVIYVGKQGGQLSPAMRIPMSYMYASIPVGGILLLWHALDAAIQAALPQKAAEETQNTEVEKA
jgi:TRAP-type C4-dicarboxylate transport system permease small subunit